MSAPNERQQEERCSPILYHEDLPIADNPFHLPTRLSSYLQFNECDAASIDQTSRDAPQHHTHRTAYDHISHTLTTMLDESTDQHIADYINNIPDNWEWSNPIGNRITKRKLQHCKWGAYKTDEEILELQQAILLSCPPPEQHTIFGTLLTTHLTGGGGTWDNRIINQLDGNPLLHPLQNRITIFQLHHSQHFTTLIADGMNFHHYDSLKGPPPPPAKELINIIRQWYIQHPQSPPQKTPHVSIKSTRTPPQQDGWTCSMHMLLITLTALYQGQIPTLVNSRIHA